MDLEHPLRRAPLTLDVLSEHAAAGPYRAWMNDPLVTRGLETPTREFTEGELRSYICAMRESSSDLLLGMFLDTGVHAGNIKLSLTKAHRRGSIGLIVGPEHWGRGLATQAITLLSAYAFSTLRLVRLTAGCHETNPASERAFVKAGFSVECRRSHFNLVGGEWVGLTFLGMLNPDWETVPKEPLA